MDSDSNPFNSTNPANINVSFTSTASENESINSNESNININSAASSTTASSYKNNELNEFVLDKLGLADATASSGDENNNLGGGIDGINNFLDVNMNESNERNEKNPNVSASPMDFANETLNGANSGNESQRMLSASPAAPAAVTLVSKRSITREKVDEIVKPSIPSRVNRSEHEAASASVPRQIEVKCIRTNRTTQPSLSNNYDDFLQSSSLPPPVPATQYAIDSHEADKNRFQPIRVFNTSTPDRAASVCSSSMSMGGHSEPARHGEYRADGYDADADENDDLYNSLVRLSNSTAMSTLRLKKVSLSPIPYKENGLKELMFTINECYYTDGKTRVDNNTMPIVLTHNNTSDMVSRKQHLFRKKIKTIGTCLKNCVISDMISIDIEAESTKLPIFCKLMIIVEGAAYERGVPVLVRDASCQAGDSYSLNKSSQTMSNGAETPNAATTTTTIPITTKTKNESDESNVMTMATTGTVPVTVTAAASGSGSASEKRSINVTVESRRDNRTRSMSQSRTLPFSVLDSKSDETGGGSSDLTINYRSNASYQPSSTTSKCERHFVRAANYGSDASSSGARFHSSENLTSQALAANPIVTCTSGDNSHRTWSSIEHERGARSSSLSRLMHPLSISVVTSGHGTTDSSYFNRRRRMHVTTSRLATARRCNADTLVSHSQIENRAGGGGLAVGGLDYDFDEYTTAPYYQYQRKNLRKKDFSSNITVNEFMQHQRQYSTSNKSVGNESSIELHIPIRCGTPSDIYRNEKRIYISRDLGAAHVQQLQQQQHQQQQQYRQDAFRSMKENMRRYLDERLNRFEAEITFHQLNNSPPVAAAVSTHRLRHPIFTIKKSSHPVSFSYHYRHENSRMRSASNGGHFATRSRFHYSRHHEPSVTNLMLMQIVNGRLMH
jgi:hypothetical protein